MGSPCCSPLGHRISIFMRATQIVLADHLRWAWLVCPYVTFASGYAETIEWARSSMRCK